MVAQIYFINCPSEWIVSVRWHFCSFRKKLLSNMIDNTDVQDVNLPTFGLFVMVSKHKYNVYRCFAITYLEWKVMQLLEMSFYDWFERKIYNFLMPSLSKTHNSKYNHKCLGALFFDCFIYDITWYRNNSLSAIVA